MRYTLLLILLLGADALILLLEASELSIGIHEARIVYESDSVLHYIINASLGIFGNNDYGLRIPMIVMHLLSVLFLYAISGRYLKYERDRLWLALIYILLPGVSSAALLVDNSGLVILLLFIFAWLYEEKRKLAYMLLPWLFIVDVSFAFLYLGLFFYALQERNTRLIVAALLLFSATMYLHGLDTGGMPKGHLLDTLGIYAAIFSPIVFIYFFYVLYRRAVLGQRSMLWYVAVTALLFSLLLSFRQRIEVQLFAPMLMVALPLAAQSFFHSYRVRLREFRKSYRTLFVISFALLCLNALSVFFNKEIYRLLEEPSGHFAYRFHVVKELAEILHERGIDCVAAGDETMQERLRFYGIDACDAYRLGDSGKVEDSVTISYYGKPVYYGYVTKVNK